MTKRIISLLLCLLLCFSLVSTAMASETKTEDSFDATVTVDRSAEETGSIQVTVTSSAANDAIFAEKAPTLSVICSYSYVKVTGPDGIELKAEIADGKVSFTVTKGGTYTITELETTPSPEPEPEPTPDPDYDYDYTPSTPITSTSTATNPDGSVTKTTTNSATGTVTEATTYPNGVKAVTETTADGEITAAVTLPVSVDSTVVTIPVTDATPGTVAVIIHPDGTEEIVQTCTVNENGVALIVDENVQVKIIDNSRSFTDVPNGEWYNDAVVFAAARGIITGNTETTFDPTTATSRTMIWTMLARLSGEDTSTGETWWSVGQQWAIANGISDGSMSDQEIPREQLVTMLYRFAQLMGMDVSVGEDTNILSYNDAFDVSEWAIPAMQWACGAGVINGDGVNLMPSSVTSRAEVAQILMNFCECMTK